MRAVFVLGTYERDALKFGDPLLRRTEALLDTLARDNDLEVTIIFAVTDQLMASRPRNKIGIERIRAERPRVLSEIAAANAEAVFCFGPVAAASVFGHGNLKEDDLLRRRHEPLGPEVPVFYTYSLENVRYAPGLKQWLHLDVAAALAGYTETVWGNYTVLLPGTKEWGECPKELRYLLKT